MRALVAVVWWECVWSCRVGRREVWGDATELLIAIIAVMGFWDWHVMRVRGRIIVDTSKGQYSEFSTQIMK